MTARKRQPREITEAEIERQFPVEPASYWWGDRWCPPVYRRDNGGYNIRFVKSRAAYTGGASFTYDCFELDADGLITTAPRGYARDYKPGRVVDIEAAVERYAEPRPDALRIGGVR